MKKILFILLATFFAFCLSEFNVFKDRSFVGMYERTLNKMMKTDGYSFEYIYEIEISGLTTKAKTEVEVDNGMKTMKMKPSVTVEYNNQTEHQKLPPIYISEVNDETYIYNKYGSNYVANKMVNDKIFLSNDKDIITGIPLESLEVEKVDDYHYTSSLSFDDMDISEQIILQDVLTSLGISGSMIKDIDIPITFKFNSKTLKLQSIEINMIRLIKDMYRILLPDMKLSDIQKVNLVLEIKELNDVSISDTQLEHAIYDDAPNHLFDLSLVYPSFKIEDIICQVQYRQDSDVYEINIDEEGKYIVQLSEFNIPLKLDVYYGNGERVLNATSEYLEQELDSQNPVAYYLKEGTYYIHATVINNNLIGKDPTIQFIKVENDDYSDFYFDEKEYPIKRVYETTEINGSIDYVGDVDVIDIGKPQQGFVHIKVSYEDLFFISIVDEERITYKTYDGWNNVNEFYLDTTVNGSTYLVLTSNTSIKDYHIEITYVDSTDDEGNSIFDDNLDEIILGQTKIGLLFPSDQTDAFELNINEPGYYNFITKNIQNKNGYEYDARVFLHNPEKDQIDFINARNSFYLERGTYYIRVERESDERPIVYSININKAIDDSTVPESITLSDNNRMDFSIDYEGDVDAYQFNVAEKGFYTMRLNSHDYGRQSTVRIRDVNEVIVSENRMRSNGNGCPSSDESENYIYLIPGQYTIELEGRMWGEYTICFDKSTNEITDDYPAATSFEGEMGVLYEGDNSIYIDYRVDEDMYILEVVKKGNYLFTHDFSYMYGSQGFVSFTDESGNKYELDQEKTKIYLTQGKYYFKFNFIEASIKNISIVHSNPTIPDEDGVTVIDSLNNSNAFIKGQMNVNDEDVYQLTLETDGILKIEPSAFYRSFHFQLFDSKGDIIIERAGLHSFKRDGISFLWICPHVDLKAGTYTIIVKDYENSYYPYELILTHDTTKKDDYSNTMLDDNKGKLEFGSNLIQMDYATDVDIFELTIESYGYYYFLGDDEIFYIGIYDKDYNLLYYTDNSSGLCPPLHPGTYYIMLYGRTAGEYRLYLSKND